jgi:hypothetical protein
VTSRKSNASRTRRSIREAADERTSTMSKPTKSEPPAESGTEAISPASQQSPVRVARGAYVAHAKACPKCQDVDRDRCTDGQRLWRGWEAACDEAYRQLAGETP